MLNRYGRAVVAVLAALAQSGPVAAQQAAAGRVDLEQAIRLALSNNRDIRDAGLGVEAAERQVREAWSSVLPTLDLTAGYTRSLSVPANFLPRIFFDPEADPDDLVAVKFGADNSWNFQLRAEQPLFQGSAFVGVGAASRYNALQQEVLRGRTQDVATRVKVAYYDALLAQEAVRLSDNTVRRIRATLDQTRKMNEAGLASNYDVLRLEVELANVEPNLRRARNASAATRRVLAVELGLAELDSLELVGSLTDLAENGDVASGHAGPNEGSTMSAAGSAADAAAPAVDASGVYVVGVAADLLFAAVDPARLSTQQAVDQALERRSDLLQLGLAERLRTAELRAEQADYLPRVTLFGTYSIVAQQNGDPVFFGASDAQRAYGRQVGIEVSLPLFAGMRRPARTAQREIAIQQVRTQTALLADRIENEVRTRLDEVTEAGSRAAAQRLAVSQAQRGYEIASTQYREGLSSQIEVTDAEVALRQSEFNHAEAVYDYLVARARLDAALGTVPLVDGDRIVLGNGDDR